MKKNAAKETKAKAENAEPSKRKLISVILGFILVLFSGTFGYLYSEGYLEGLFPNEEEKPAFSLFKQDENGFYYYQTDYEPGDYYFSAKNLSGDALREELQKIIRTGFNPRSYEEAKHILAYCDRDPLKNNESVRGIYDSAEIATYWIGTGSGAWQREHVWPNSKLGVARVGASQRNQASDIHNLRAITGINQTRSNRYFADGSGEAKTVGTEGFYPGDEHKGDVARILFYMEIMYDGLTLTNDVSKLIDDTNTNYKPEGAFMGILDLLIRWHKEDPVDEFEMQRNEFIYSGTAYDQNGKAISPQGNRNPFIDRPEYVHLIWEGKEIGDLKTATSENKLGAIIIRIYYVKFYRKNEFLV